jgi:flagellar motility protein MotE (MotC chaperone)
MAKQVQFEENVEVFPIPKVKGTQPVVKYDRNPTEYPDVKVHVRKRLRDEKKKLKKKLETLRYDIEVMIQALQDLDEDDEEYDDFVDHLQQLRFELKLQKTIATLYRM